jgi:hypothetical protein
LRTWRLIWAACASCCSTRTASSAAPRPNPQASTGHHRFPPLCRPICSTFTANSRQNVEAPCGPALELTGLYL